MKRLLIGDRNGKTKGVASGPALDTSCTLPSPLLPVDAREFRHAIALRLELVEALLLKPGEEERNGLKLRASLCRVQYMSSEHPSIMILIFADDAHQKYRFPGPRSCFPGSQP